MKLSTRGTLWIVAVIVIAAISSFLTMFSVWELRTTNRLTSDDYEIALNVRRLRTLIFEYSIYGQTAGQKGADHKEYIKFKETKDQLAAFIQEDQGNIHSPQVSSAFTTAKNNIQGLFHFKPIPEGRPDAISALNPAFQQKLESILKDLDVMANHSAMIVGDDRERNIVLSKRLAYIVFGIFIVTLIISYRMLTFLRRTILLPIQSLAETIQKVKAGDYSARWPIKRIDEIGTMGQTINETIAELEYRRTERIRIISAIVHDLKNPLSAIGMSCQLFLLKEQEASNSKTIGLVKNIHAQVDRLKRMIEDLLRAASAIQPGFDLRIKQWDLLDLAQETCKLFQNSQPDRKYKLLISNDKLPPIFADQDRIAQIFTNLLSNATKYSPANTEIELTIGANETSFLIEVRDRGIGIPEDKLELIFQPFTRLEQGRKMESGLGIGLSTVKEIVSAHEGRISAHRRPGGGTIFRIELPIQGPRPQVKEELPATA